MQFIHNHIQTYRNHTKHKKIIHKLYRTIIKSNKKRKSKRAHAIQTPYDNHRTYRRHKKTIEKPNKNHKRIIHKPYTNIRNSYTNHKQNIKKPYTHKSKSDNNHTKPYDIFIKKSNTQTSEIYTQPYNNIGQSYIKTQDKPYKHLTTPYENHTNTKTHKTTLHNYNKNIKIMTIIQRHKNIYTNNTQLYEKPRKSQTNHSNTYENHTKTM